ncbi:MAG TPA: zinc ribbon domain-containing protein [Pyrinomonadaceae bacterium]
MGAEIWMASMQAEGDHSVMRVMAGDADDLRARLADAVERLGYHVISDQAALVARRGNRRLGRSGCSFDLRDYATELIVTLKPKSAGVTLATFNFTVRNYYYWTGGDKRTLECEADALAALAVSQQWLTACTACGTETTDDSRFCRRCGAPLALEEPAELEALRLTAGTRAGYKNIAWGLLVLVSILIPVVILLTLGASEKAFNAAAIIAASGGGSALFMLLAGAWRIHRTLNPARDKKDERPTLASTTLSRAIGGARATAALPPRSAESSITEGTTELLEAPAREFVPIELRHRDGDTGPIN